MARLVIGTSKTATVPVLEKGIPAVINSLNVTPSTSAQTIIASGGVDGYSPINVAAVDNTIDNNITAGNIKDGVTILGVTGNYTGVTPTGTTYITANGVYDVTNFASADVQVSGSGPAYYIEYGIDANNKLTAPSSIINLSGVEDIGDYALYYAYYNNTNISGVVDFSSLIDISGSDACYYMFYGCTGLTSVDLSSLTMLSGNYACNNMFYGCRNLVSCNLANLTTISGTEVTRSMFDGSGLTGSLSLPNLTTISGTNAARSMFGNCGNMTSLSLPSLTTITGEGATRYFAGTCTNLTSVSLPVLNTITGTQPCYQMFNGCTSLTTLSFPALKTVSDSNVFRSMFSNNMACTVHFPSNLSSYNFNVGGTSTVVLYDLPATA